MRGRPPISEIRKNIVEILFFAGECHGYKVYRIYNKAFPDVSRRSVYYQLKRGCDMGLFRVSKSRREKGEYSWGNQARKIYYTLGPFARPKGDKRVEKALAELSEESE